MTELRQCEEFLDLVLDAARDASGIEAAQRALVLATDLFAMADFDAELAERALQYDAAGPSAKTWIGKGDLGNAALAAWGYPDLYPPSERPPANRSAPVRLISL